MDKHNNLNVALLTNKCNEAIHNLNQDIEDNEMVLTNLQNIVAEERLSGEAISAFKNMLADYYAVTKLNVEADESDITDFNTLLANLTESLYGDVIIPAHDKAQADRDEYRRLAREQRRNSQYFNPAVIPYASEGTTPIENPYETNAKKLDSLADGCEIERLKWENKMKLYDQIESNTAGLFQNGKAIRDVIKGMLEAMNKQSISGNYDQMVAVECLSKNGWIEYLDKIKCDSTYTTLQLEALYADYPELETYLENEKKIESYYAMIPHIPDSEKKTVMDEINKLKAANAQLLIDIGTNNPEFAFLAPTTEYMKSIGMDSASIDEILLYWLCVGDPNKLEGIELPAELMIDFDKSLALVQWKVEGNPNAAFSQFCKELTLYLIINGVIDGEDLSNDVYLRDYLDKQWQEQVLDNIDYLDILYDIGSTEPVALSFLFAGAGNWVGTNVKRGWLKTGNFLWKNIYELALINGLPTGALEEIYNAGLEDERELDAQAVDAFMKGIAGKSGKDCNNAYNILARMIGLNYIDADMVNKHYELNKTAWDDYKNTYGGVDCILKDGKQYIEHQNQFTKDYIGSNLYYGKYIKKLSENCMSWKDSNGVVHYNYDSNGLYGAGNTCEIIATYNVLTHLGMEVYFPDLIKDFEENSPILGGNFGSAPDQYAGYIEAMGYETITYEVGTMNYEPGKEDDYTKMLDECDSIIISEWNSDNAGDAMHTMAITIDKEVQEDGSISYIIVRHNDDNVYTERHDKDGLYELINNYTKGEGAEPLKVLGIKTP